YRSRRFAVARTLDLRPAIRRSGSSPTAVGKVAEHVPPRPLPSVFPDRWFSRYRSTPATPSSSAAVSTVAMLAGFVPDRLLLAEQSGSAGRRRQDDVLLHEPERPRHLGVARHVLPCRRDLRRPPRPQTR